MDFISGPGAGSRPLSFMNGKTGAFTDTASVCGLGMSREESFSPRATLAAILARGSPVALATKGNVLDPLGFTSNTYNSSSLMAN